MRIVKVKQQGDMCMRFFDDDTKFTLPAIIGLIITTPLYMLGDITDYTFLALSSIPMIGGVLLSGCLGIKSGMKDLSELKKTYPTIMKDQFKVVVIGVLIGAFPLAVFTWYVLDGVKA